MKKLLLIEHGGAKKQFVLKCVKLKGLELYFACTSAPSWLKQYTSQNNIIITDTYNSVKLLTDIVSFMAINAIKFDTIGTFYEHTVSQQPM